MMTKAAFVLLAVPVSAFSFKAPIVSSSRVTQARASQAPALQVTSSEFCLTSLCAFVSTNGGAPVATDQVQAQMMAVMIGMGLTIAWARPYVTTALLAPVFSSSALIDRELHLMDKAEEEDVCELVTASAMAEAVREGWWTGMPLHVTGPEEEAADWWTCPGMALGANCREIFLDGEYQVACTF